MRYNAIMKNIFGILAHPAGHSLSPAMHNAAFRHLGIDAEFRFFDVPPADLAAFFARVRQEKIAGLAVSIPYKEKVASFLDTVSPVAQAIGAVNTIYWENDKLCGTNTDHQGFSRALGDVVFDRVLVLGAGGAARAVLYALRGKKIYLWARRRAQAEELAMEFSCTVIEDFMDVDVDLVVNTTPVGMSPLADVSPMPPNFWRQGQVAYDLVMNPRKTRFLREAEAAGAEIITGDEMLLYQGMAQFVLWTGREAPEGVMREALKKD